MLQFRYVRFVSRWLFAMWLGTFSLSQMNDVELARTLSWRENALFEERKRTFMGPGERIWRCGRLHVRFAPFDVRWQKYNKIDRTTKLFAGYSVLNP